MTVADIVVQQVQRPLTKSQHDSAVRLFRQGMNELVPVGINSLNRHVGFAVIPLISITAAVSSLSDVNFSVLVLVLVALYLLLYLVFLLVLQLSVQGQIRTALDGDLNNITGYYSGNQSGFWVATLEGKEPFLSLYVDLKGHVIGTIALDCSKYRDDPKKAELRRMVVDPSYRGKGVARKLLDTLVDHAKNNGVREIQLTTRQPKAVQLYMKYGFQVTKEQRRVRFGKMTFFKMALE